MPARHLFALTALACLMACTGAPVVEDFAEPPALPIPVEADLIERQVLFGNPDRALVRLSPDGTYLSFVAPLDGVLNVWVGPANEPEAAEPVTNDQDRGIRLYFWTYTSRHLVYLQDHDGDEDWTVHVIDLESGDQRALSPESGVNARVMGLSRNHPERLLVGLNERDPGLHDVYRIDIISGERERLVENPGFVGFLADDELRLRMALRLTPEGGQEWFLRTDEGDSWESFLEVPMEDMMTTSFFAFDPSGESVYMIDSRERDTAALAKLDLESGRINVLHFDPRADVNNAMFHPTERTVQAAAVEYERSEWTVLDASIAPDLERLARLEDGDLEVISRTDADDLWVVVFLVDDGPTRYYMYERESGEANFLFTNRSRLEDHTFSSMEPVLIEARDGLVLVSYLTIPHFVERDEEGRPAEPLPLVLNVHGGPWWRDSWGYNPEHQWLANRGYAVLSVNFRGSTGFGKAFLNAGNLEWGGAMHDDLIDAVEWAVEAGIADPELIAIMGASYGGYATLVGMTFTPEVFACGVNIVGVSNLVTFLETIPPYWAPMFDMLATRVGDPRTEEGVEFLRERSPLTHVDNIRRPLLIAQGAHDPRVVQAESDQIVEAMQEREIPVCYVLYPDEGHGFARPANRISFYAISEAFLSRCLGGRYEPVGDDFAGASLQVLTGVEEIPGLQETLDARP